VNNVGNIIGAVLIAGLAGAGVYFGVQYMRAGQQGFSPMGAAAPAPSQPKNVDAVRTGTTPQLQQPGDNTAAQVQAWGSVALNLLGQATSFYEQHWGSKS
jgi:hypothetical protein